MNPKQWREQKGLSLAALAIKLNLSGKNPAATLRRWECGLRRCPDAIVVQMERLTEGRVTADDWLRARLSYSSSPGVIAAGDDARLGEASPLSTEGADISDREAA